MKKKRWIYLLLPIVTLILEALPYGAVLNFIRPAEDGTKGNFRELYSYFDLTPFGWANFAPFITAIITCIVFLLLLAYCFTGKKNLAIKAKNILYVCVVFSFGPLVAGIRYFSFVGLLISLSLMAELIVLHFTLKTPKKEDAE